MSDELDLELDECGCCAPASSTARGGVENAPGLSSLRYRAGTQPEFLARMIAALPRTKIGDDGVRPLGGLTSRSTDDPSIAILDAWAIVADVLTFYQERIANEGFLRTATERRSVLELARAIGYELRPGVAASTFLAFTLDGTPGSAASAAVPPGTRVQSVPVSGGLPQTFETSEPLDGRAAWNELRPRLRQPQALDDDAATIFVAGTATEIRTGDLVLFVTEGDGGTETAAKSVVAVAPEEALGRTRVELAEGTPPTAGHVFVAAGYAAATISPAPLVNANVQSYVVGSQWHESDLAAFMGIQGWNQVALEQAVWAGGKQAPLPPPGIDEPPLPGVYGFAARVGPFGHNAPRWAGLPSEMRTVEGAAYEHSWDGEDEPPITVDSAGESYAGADFYLERVVPEVVRGSFVVLEQSGTRRAYRVTATNDKSLADFAISARATGVSVQRPDGGSVQKPANGSSELDDFLMRSTTVHAVSRPLPLAELPIDAPFGRDTAEASQLTLDSMVLGLAVGRPVVITGERDDLAGVVVSEAAVLSDVVHSGGHTTLFFESELAHTFVRRTATINANVVRATHGETVHEVLGGGDLSRPYLRFALKRPPLTHVAGGSGGARSTLQLRVNDILWQETPSLYPHGPRDEVYVVRIDDDRVVTVTFGDGQRGARTPTGAENVTATYRTGIGHAGEVPAGTLTLLQTRPPGVRGVTNPVAASGAAEPEALADARSNAPLTVLAMGRIVSLRDYEDFAAAFAGVGKAQAVELSRGEASFVHITIAGANGSTVPTTSDLYRSLVDEVAAASDPIRHFQVQSFQPVFFHLAATLRVDPRRRSEAVIAAAVDAVRDAFSFPRRGFGQPVTAAEVVTVLQRVEGVESVDLDALFRVDDAASPPPATLSTIIRAERARLVAEAAEPAQLLLVNPFGIAISEAPQP